MKNLDYVSSPVLKVCENTIYFDYKWRIGVVVSCHSGVRNAQSGAENEFWVLCFWSSDTAEN